MSIMMKHCCLFVACLITLLAIVGISSQSVGTDHAVSRIERAAKQDCHYTKGPWSECNASTNKRIRTMTLKKGEDEIKCEKTKIIEKKCKKVACKYEKGDWSDCNERGQMVRTDTLKNAHQSDSSCQKNRQLAKKCKNQTNTPRPTKVQKRKPKPQDHHGAAHQARPKKPKN